MDFDIHGVLLLVWLCNGLSTSFVLNAVVQHHTQELRCGDHVCHDSQHDIPPCSPNLLSSNHHCFCDTRTCVDHTLISLVSGHQVTGLICSNDDSHVCHARQVCQIFHDNNGQLRKHCVDPKHLISHLHECRHLLNEQCYCTTQECVFGQFTGHQVAALICSDQDDHSCHADQVCEIYMTSYGRLKKQCIHMHGSHMGQCTQLPKVGQKCYCTTQKCVFGQYNAPTTMSTTSKLTTTGTTIAATTISQTTVQPTTVKLTSVQPTTVKSTTVQPTTAQPSTSVVQAALSIPTTTVVTAVTSSTNNTCTDDEDSNFSCVVYEMMYGLCDATTGTLFNIAQKRCQAFCGICAGNNTSGIPPASLPTQPTCIDHDARCSQFQFHICSSNVSQNFVISTCPKSCNKCAEYLASLNPQPVTTTAQPVINTAQPVTTKAQQVTTTSNPITTTPKPVTKTAARTTTSQSQSVTTATGTRTCHICGEMTFQIPCSNREIGRDLPQTCKTGEDYCMTDIVQDAQGNVDVFKRCVDLATCENKWNTESAGFKYCKQYGVVPNPDAYSCHFCCTQDKCNSMLVPNSTTWYTKTN